MQINQNILAIRTQGTLAVTQDRLDKSIQKLSSGLRINSAADDAAGLAISEKLRRQIRGLSRAVLNAQDGISMIQTGEGALNESTSILQRMRELAVQAGNDTLTGNDRLEIQKEVTQLRDDLNRISTNTEFNTKKLLDGSQTALVSTSSGAAKGVVTGGSGGVGGEYAVSIGLVSGGISQMVRSQIFTKAGTDPNTLADGSTQLQSIAQFYDANGVFALESSQTITIQGNDKTTSLTIDGQMTLDKLAASIQNSVNGAKGLDIENSKTMVVGTAISGLAGVGGYLQITSGMIGKDGQIGFLADQPVLTALGLATMRDAKNNLYEVNLTGGDGSSRQVRTDTNQAAGLLDGVDVKFNSQAAQIAGTMGIEQGMSISAGGLTFSASVSGFGLTLTVASGTWTMEGLARSLSSQFVAGNISGANATIVDGELRINFTPTTSTIASTIVLGSTSSAASLGFMNGSYSGFADGKKDTSTLVNGFSIYATSADAGVAVDTVTFTIDDGTTSGASLTFTAFTTLNSAQATIADMVEFTSFQASVNKQLGTAGVYVRLDQVGNSMAFTALRVGKESLDSGVVNVSAVDLSIAQGGTLSMTGKFGFDSATTIASRGSGDKNFRMHVVDNAPQYQIGADQGQSMKVAFSNMSAESLGVSSLDMTSIAGATDALGKLNIAIDKVSAERSKLGAYENRLQYAINNLRNTDTNLTAAESRIRDTDMASEMIEFTRNQVVSQAGNAMLAQANTIPQQVLQLLK
ncbi:MAG: hypothetical protein HQM09_00515 [Candidatus Riflebacteria bacterium]|nr:hypothetical protein [Candidatus Riflebacteria bacterium]